MLPDMPSFTWNSAGAVMRILLCMLVASLLGAARCSGSDQKSVAGETAIATQPQPEFLQTPLSSALSGMGQICSGDLDMDGNIDIAGLSLPLEQDMHSATRLRIALADGHGGYGIVQELQLPGVPKSRICTADFDRDGDLDLFVMGHDETTVWLLKNDGAARFSLAAEPVEMAPGVPPHCHSMLLADVNSDGWPDLLSDNADDNSVSVQLNMQGSFVAAAGSPFSAGPHPYEALRAMDLNEDGKLDLAVPNLLGPAVSILLGDGRGAFELAAGSPTVVSTRPGYLAGGDLNGDGHPDLAVTHDDQNLVSILLGDGSGGMQQMTGSPFEAAARSWPVEIADMDGDGQLDLLFAGNDNVLRIHYGSLAEAGLAPFQELALSGGRILYLHPVDLNSDGRLDLLVECFDNGNVLEVIQQ